MSTFFRRLIPVPILLVLAVFLLFPARGWMETREPYALAGAGEESGGSLNINVPEDTEALEEKIAEGGLLSYYGNKLLRRMEQKPTEWPDFYDDLLISGNRIIPVVSSEHSAVHISVTSSGTSESTLVHRKHPPFDDNVSFIHIPEFTGADTGYVLYPLSMVPYGLDSGCMYSFFSDMPGDPRILKGLQFILENAPPYKTYCCYPADYENASKAAAALAIRAYLNWCTDLPDDNLSFENLEASDTRIFPPDYFAYLYYLYNGAIAASEGQTESYSQSSGSNVFFLSADTKDAPVLIMLAEASDTPDPVYLDKIQTDEPVDRISEESQDEYPGRGGEEASRALSVITADALSGKPLSGCQITLRYDSEDYASAVTDDNGEAVFTDLPSGTITLVQNNRLKGYLDPALTYTVSISGSDSFTRVYMLDQPKSGMLYIFATDAAGEPVEDAVFKIIEKKRELFTFVTDEEGFAYGYLPTGTYSILCDELPAGYKTVSGPDTITIRRDESTQTDYVITRAETESMFDVITYYVITQTHDQVFDLVCGSALHIAAKYLNPAFLINRIHVSVQNTLYFAKNRGICGLFLSGRENGRPLTERPETASEGQKAEKRDEKVWPVSIYAVDKATGEMLSDVYIEVLPRTGSPVRFYADSPGISIPGLASGDYYARILLVPEYYAVPEQAIRFSIDEDGTIAGETEFLLEKLFIILTAEDENGNPLSGACFELMNTITGETSREISDLNGAVLFRSIPFGDYLISEVLPAPGYSLNSTPVILHTDGSSKSVSFPAATLVSSCRSVSCEAVSRSGDPVPDVEILLQDTCGSILQQVFSPQSGQALLYGLPYGSYTVSVGNLPAGFSTENAEYSLLISPETGQQEQIRIVLDPVPE